MGAANDFLNAFYTEFPQANDGKLSPQQLNKLLAEFQREVNQHPVSDFDQLTPKQMHYLLYEPLSDKCILQVSPSVSQHADHIPLFRLVEFLLAEIAKTGVLKLTDKGNLPIHVCEQLVTQQLIMWEYMEHLSTPREEDVPYLRPLKVSLLDLGIIKKRKNTLSLTKNGQQFLKESNVSRFKTLLLYFGHRFNWVQFYDIPDHGRCGQLGWAFSLVLLKKYGVTLRESEFYSSKLINAFAKQLSVDSSDEKQQNHLAKYHYVYAVRFFECFANWFGLVNIDRKKGPSFSDRLTITKSDLFDRVFLLKV